METLLGSAEGRQQLTSMFQLCAAPHTPLDFTLFSFATLGVLAQVWYRCLCRVFKTIASWVCAAAFVGITVRMPVPTVAQVVQYNNIEPHNVTQICDAITSAASPLDGVAELVNAINSQSPTFTCVTATYTDYVAQLQNTSFVSAGAASRAWRYQTCAEFAYFQSTDGSSQAFGDLIPVSSFDQLCVDVFGAAFNASTIVENVAWTNSVYGGTDVEASNIVFPNGR